MVRRGGGGLEQHRQASKLSVTFGEDDSECRVVLRAIAEKQGITSEHELDRLADGSPDERLRVPAHLRGALGKLGLQGALAPLNLFEIKEEDPILLAGQTWSSRLRSTQVPWCMFAHHQTALVMHSKNQRAAAEARPS